jgi:hypothetical protein
LLNLDRAIGSLNTNNGEGQSGHLSGESVAADLKNLDDAVVDIESHVGGYDDATHANIDKSKSLTANVEALGDKVGELDTDLTNLQNQVGSISEAERAGTTYLHHEAGVADTVSKDLLALDRAVAGVAQNASEELAKAIGSIAQKDESGNVIPSVMGADGSVVSGDTRYIADENQDATGNTPRSVADNLRSLDKNLSRVDTALGGTTDSSGAWTADLAPDATVSYDAVTVSKVTEALNGIKGAIGSSAQLQVKTGVDEDNNPIYANINGVTADKSVNSNLAAINSTLGDFSTLNATTNLAGSQNVADALKNIDTIIGDRSTISYAGIDGENPANYSMDGVTSISGALAHVASHIGTANFMVNTGETDEEGNALSKEINGVSASNTVNANIAALNTSVGDVARLKELMYTSNGYDANGDLIPTSVTDAIGNLNANVGNLYSVTSKIAYNVNDLQNRYSRLRKDFETGMASMAAMSALAPNARATGNTQLSVGTGAYSGHTAAAVGAYHWVTDNLMLNAGAAWGESSDTIYRLGVTYSW